MYIYVYTCKTWQLEDPLCHIHAFSCPYCNNITLILSTKGNSPTGAQSCQGYCIIFWCTHTNGNTTDLMNLQGLCLHDRASHPARLQYDYPQI